MRPAARPAGDRRLILGIVIVAALLRLPTAFVEMYHHPDEVWQYLEPAYGLVTGRSVVTWEYRGGMRSWLIPVVLAGPIWLGKAIAPATALYRILPRLLAVVLSLGIVGFGAGIGLRLSRLHALVAGLVLATSFELVYFAARTSSDTIAVALFVPAAWALLPHEGRSARQLLGGGLLLGLSFACRFQLAPALLTLAIGACRKDARAWRLVIAGGLAGLAVDGAVDALQGLVPLRWMIENLRLNLIENRSADYGVEPPLWFVLTLLRLWWWAALPILALAAWGARRQPVLMAVALVNLAAHSLIAHKEYRFVFLTVVLLILLAGLGTAELIRWALSRRPERRRAVAALAGLFWIGCSAAAVTSPAAGSTWRSNRRDIALARAAAKVPGGCGLAFFQPDADRLIAYYYYDRPNRIYYFDRASAFSDVRRYGAAFNTVITSADRAPELGPAYRAAGCFGAKSVPGRLVPLDNRCLFVRPGGCTPLARHDFDINAVLVTRRD